MIIVSGKNAKVNIYINNAKNNDFCDKSQKSEEICVKNAKNCEKWTEKMQKKEKTVQKMYLLAQKIPELKGRYQRMKDCGKYLEFNVCQDCGHWTITHAQLCRDRLCPVCNWRLSLKRFAAMCDIFAQINIADYKSTFLTLTIKNCEAGKLSETISQMTHAWDIMLHRKYFKTNLRGWARSIEITYNTQQQTWHPHIHIIMLWDKNVTLDGQQDRIAQEWQTAIEVDYKPVVDNQLIKSYHPDNNNALNDNTVKALLETSKYSIKDETLDNLTLSEMQEILYAVKNRRLIAFGGVLREAKQKIGINIDDIEEKDEGIKYNICTGCHSNNVIEMIAEWSFSNGFGNYDFKTARYFTD